MLATYSKRLAAALIVVATLSLTAGSSVTVAQTAENEPQSAPLVAARDYLQATGFRARFEAKFPDMVQSKIALKILVEREPILENEVAKIYAGNFTVEELRDASKFYSTSTGTMYFNFNVEMNTNPLVTPEIYRSEVAKRFSSQQRAEIFAFSSTAVGQKMARLVPSLAKVIKNAAEQWGRETQQVIDHAVRAGEGVS
jgi:hypothetical protein